MRDVSKGLPFTPQIERCLRASSPNDIAPERVITSREISTEAGHRVGDGQACLPIASRVVHRLQP